MLKIKIFGAPAVWRTGQPVEIQHRAARALLWYLAGQKSPINRSTLAGLFWPELDETKARATLRDYLHKLRHDLQDNLFILASPETLALNPERVEVDYSQYKRLTAEIFPALHSIAPTVLLPGSLYAQITQTVELCQESAFLTGSDLDFSTPLTEWRNQSAQTVETEILVLLERLAEHEHLLENESACLRWLTLGTHFSHLNEIFHEKILHSLMRQGAFARARAYFDALKKTFQAEDFDNLPESLAALEDFIFRPQNEAKTFSVWAVHPTLQTDFIGQTESLRTAKRIIARGGTLILFGEAGSGKTRLIQEAFQRYAPASRLLLAPCQPLEESLPFAPWIATLRSNVRPEEWRQLDSVWARPLTLLFPEIARLRPGLAAILPTQREIPRLTLLEALRQILLLLSERAPLFVFFDDSQWADESTLEGISYLLKTGFFSRQRATLALASRIEIRNPLLDQLLLTTFPESIARLEIHPLSQDEITALCQSVLGVNVPGSLTQRLERDMGGNPLFLLETLRAMRETSLVPALEESNNLPLPHSVQEILTQRVNALSEPARALIQAAAVMGSRIEILILLPVLGLENEAGVCAIEELEQAHLMSCVDEATWLYAFAHEKIREALLAQISPARERLLHQKIAASLQANLPQAQPARLAYHFEKAGDFLRAFGYWIEAGKYAYHLNALGETTRAFHQAEHLLSLSTRFSDLQIYQLYTEWNKVAFENDNPDEVERINHALRNFGRERSNPLLIGTALSCLSDSGMARNRFDEGLKNAQLAYPYLNDSGNDYELGNLFIRTGVLTYMRGEIRASQAWFIRALALTEATNRLDLLQIRATAHYQMAITETLCGYPLQGQEHARKSLTLHHDSNDTYGEVTAYSVLSLSGYLMGQYTLGRQAALDGLERAERIDGWRMDGYINSYAGMNEVELGLLGAAWQHGQKAIEIGRNKGHGEITGLGCQVIGNIYIFLQNYKKAAEFYQQGMMASGEHFVALENMHRYGYCLYKQGQRNIGLDFLRTALEKSKQAELGSIHLLATMNELEILAEDDPQETFENRAEWFNREISTRLKQALGQYTLARLKAGRALRTGNHHQAAQLLEPILPWYRQIGQRRNELNSLKILALALSSIGDDPSSQCLRMGELLRFTQENLAPAPLEEELRSFRVKFLAG